ncbi:hypothetical protein ACP70R_043373 [Stipagrostis hirtigluma subsp. patula]
MAPTTTETIHMVSGDGDTSYARNSRLQAGEQGNVKPMIEEAVASLLNGASRFPDGFTIADLGCSSGPNTLVLASAAIDAVRRRCSQLEQQPPELCVHFNDLPGNDFNSVIKSLAVYKQTLDEGLGPVLTSIVPGSFHGRLFNKCSLHLVCSNVSLHWLSRVPEDLVRNKIPFYDSNEEVRQAKRATVIEAYARQFDRDFTRFLGLRAEEMVPGGRMVISMMGQRYEDSVDLALVFLEFIHEVLHEMATMGLLDKRRLDSFYIPIYGPSEKELRATIETEGSFSINKIAVHEPRIGVGRGATPKSIANMIRSTTEPVILQHFGSSTDMDEFARIVERLMNSRPLGKCPNRLTPYIAASLTRRT